MKPNENYFTCDKYMKQKQKENESVCLSNDTNTNVSKTNESNIRYKNKVKIRKIGDEIMHYEQNGMKPCCNKGCVYDFTLEEIQHLREEVHSMDKKEKKCYIKSKIVFKNEFNNNKCNKFTVKEKLVCKNCFLICYGVSNSIIYNKTNILSQLNIRAKPKEDSIINFLTELSNKCDYMPDSNEIHLLSSSKYAVYEMFINANNEHNLKDYTEVTYSYFLRVWKAYLKHIKVRKVNRFTKCAQCTVWKSELRQTLDQEKRNKLKKLLHNHALQQLQDRNEYENNKRLAIELPSKYMSLAIDGADFQKYGLPYFNIKDKNSDQGNKIPINTVGVIFHGHGSFIYTLPCNLPSDSNSIIHCIQRSITQMKELYENKKLQWPSILFVQVI